MTNTAQLTPAPGQRGQAGRLVPGLDIVGCGVISPAGVGLSSIAAALRDDRRPQRTVADAVPPDWPPLRAAAADFDPAELLGPKGLSRATRTDQLSMAACLLALDDADTGPQPTETGIVLGTAIGSASAQLAFLRDTFEQERPYLVNPSHFPGTLMNSAAGKAAIRHGLTGLNATVSGGPLAAMHALRYARTALLAGRARRMLAGGVEELSSLTAWAWQRTGALAAGVSLGEGCAVLVLDLPDSTGEITGNRARTLGRLLACEIGFADPVAGVSAVSAQLAAAVDTALARSGVTADDVTVTVAGAAGQRGWGAVEDRVLRRLLPTGPRRRLPVHLAIGETYGAGTALQLAAVLADWRHPPDDAPLTDRIAVLTAVGFDGSVGCLVVAHPRFIA